MNSNGNLAVISTILAVVIGTVILTSALSQPVSAANHTDRVSGNPSIDVFLPDRVVTPGEETTVQLQLQNTGEIDNNGAQSFESYVTQARGVRVDVESDPSSDEVDVTTQEQAIGDIPRGAPVTVPVTVSVPESADGDYDLDVSVEYFYYDSVVHAGSQIQSSDRDEETETQEVELRTRDAPVFAAKNIESNVSIGEKGVVTAEIENFADQDLQDARIDIFSSSGILTIGQSQSSEYIGTWEQGETKEITFPISFDENILSKSFFIQSSIQFENEDGQERTGSVDGLFVRPVGENELTTLYRGTTSPIGDSGQTELRIRNDGSQTYRDATVQLSSRTPAVSFSAGRTSTEVRIGDWKQDEIKNITVGTSVSADAVKTQYVVDATLKYETTEGLTASKSIDGVSIRPVSEQDTTVTVVDSKVKEGREGDVTFEVTNNGPRDISDAELSVASEGVLTFTEDLRNIGDLEALESTQVSVAAESPQDLDSLDQPVSTTLTFDGSHIQSRASEDELVTTSVQSAADTFSVNLQTDGTIEPGQSATVPVTVTNNRDSHVNNVDAKFTGTGPISVSKDTVFVGSLDAGEQVIMNVTLSAGGGAIPNTHALEADFQYEEADGDTRLSKIYSETVTVVEPEESSGIPTAVVVLIAVVSVVTLGLAVRYRQRLRELIDELV